MAMNIGSEDAEEEVIGVINTTPLVDVMLVLLIIFLITIPVVTHTIKVKLPEEQNKPYVTNPQNIQLAVNKQGQIFWSEKFVPDQTTLLTRLKVEAAKRPQPEVHIRGDQATKYEDISKVISAAQDAGIGKIAFVTTLPVHQ